MKIWIHRHCPVECYLQHSGLPPWKLFALTGPDVISLQLEDFKIKTQRVAVNLAVRIVDQEHGKATFLI